MSGVPFNPMRKTPPPPPYLDTVGLNPEEYISVEPGDGPLFLVNRECLRMSPFIRRAFEKRVNVSLPEIEITFIAPSEEVEEEELEVQSQESEPLSPMDVQEGEEREEEPAATEGEQGEQGKTEQQEEADEAAATGTGEKKKKQETIFPEDPLYAIPKIQRPPEVYTETLLNDKTVLIRFPQHKSAVLEIVISYLYYKHRYEGRPHEPRDGFSVPSAFSLEIMKLAAVLEC